MGGNYPPIVNNVTNQTFTPEEDSFGIPLVLHTVSTDVATAWAALPTPRTLQVTPNDYKTALAAIGLTSSDSHWRHLVALFGQTDAKKKVTTAVLGRRLAPVAKVVRVTVGGFADGDYTIQVDAETPITYPSTGKTAAQIRTELLALFAGNTTVSAASQGAASIDFTALDVGYNFALTLESPADAMTQTVQTANVGAADDFAVVRAENPRFFDVYEGSHGTAAILELAKVIEGNTAHFWAETNASNVKTNAGGNVAAKLKAFNYKDTSLRYHHTSAELFSAALGGRVLAYDPGQVQISHRKLVGVTKRNYSAEAGVVANFSTNNVGYYDSAGGGTTLYNYTVGGSFIELERNKYVIEAGLDLEHTSLLQNNDIIAYTTKEGVAAVKAATQKGLNRYATQGGTGYIIRETILINTTPIEDQGNDNQSKLKVGGVTWSAKVRIGINEIETSGYLSIV